jgi:hypothetical protein
VPVERIEPRDAPSQQAQDWQWCVSVNRECRCPGGLHCGDRYWRILQARRALGPYSKQNRSSLKELRLKAHELHGKPFWEKPHCHFHLASPAQDVLYMPRELLPSVETVCTAPRRWPFLTRATIADVKAMTLVRYRHSGMQQLSSACHTMKARMQQYAETGRGTVAEAIMHNEFHWCRQKSKTGMEFVFSREFIL